MGRGILIGAATITSIYINDRFRAKLKLRSHGKFLTMLGITLGTTSAAAISHTEVLASERLISLAT